MDTSDLSVTAYLERFDKIHCFGEVLLSLFEAVCLESNEESLKEWLGGRVAVAFIS